MIIWLASYPRSGNTLTRTLIKSCFDLNSYDDEAEHIQRILSPDSRDMAGYKELPEPWESFYPKAKASASTYLIKTHQLPRDDSPAIYVVRDGRFSIWSYLKFLGSYFPESHPSLLKLVLGHDYYGGWSDHIQAWTKDPKFPLLTVRFEDLVNADSTLIEKIVQFIKYAGPVKPWQNPMAELHEKNPQFYREGKTVWKRPEAWTNEIQNLFSIMHGDCQHQFGYEVEPTLETPAELDFFRDICGLVQSLVGQNKQLQNVCQERMALIQYLDSEAKKRLEIIQKAGLLSK